MAGDLQITVNGRMVPVSASPDTPLLYVLTDELQLRGPRFGCGLAQCGSCSVLADGVEIRSCVTPLAAVTDKSITTLEGLAAWYAAQKNLATVPALHPLQQAFIDEQALHCGYCFNGMTIKAAELLANNSKPSEHDIRQGMNGHLCRCGTYARVMKAIQVAARTMAGETP
jgi:aerobic-type carbon monoxide dehydrogenase small subunit (CoxS/CutS family)